MKEIINQHFEGERPLFAETNLHLENVTIGVGESSLKKCIDVVADNCTFNGKYPFWHAEHFRCNHCTFLVGARSGLWYSKDCTLNQCIVEAPKMFREMDGVKVFSTNFPNGQEMFWHCRNVLLQNVRIDDCDYLFMSSHNIKIDNYEQHGNYSFQYATNVEISNAKIHSKDAFWNTHDVVIRDSELHGEYLGWHSRSLTLINCLITGTQPLCYAHNLKMINCRFGEDADLAFEESDVNASITTPITSIKNPTTGHIIAPYIGETIIDEHLQAPGDCKIEIKD